MYCECIVSIVERDVSNVFILNEKYAYFILNRIKYWPLFIQNNKFSRGCDGCDGMSLFCKCMAAQIP